jgi:hypothetical protein
MQEILRRLGRTSIFLLGLYIGLKLLAEQVLAGTGTPSIAIGQADPGTGLLASLSQLVHHGINILERIGLMQATFAQKFPVLTSLGSILTFPLSLIGLASLRNFRRILGWITLRSAIDVIRGS